MLQLEDAWHVRFDEYLSEKPGGKDAWSRLVFGTNVALLLILAANITSSDAPCALKDQRTKLRKFSKDVRAAIPQILATAELVKNVNCELRGRSADLKRFADLPDCFRVARHPLQSSPGTNSLQAVLSLLTVVHQITSGLLIIVTCPRPTVEHNFRVAEIGRKDIVKGYNCGHLWLLPLARN